MRRKLSWLLGVAACLVLAGTAKAQNRVLTGRVIDNDSKQGITGAVVNVVGGRAATQANESGTFRLNVPPGDVTLTVRALGYTRVNTRVLLTQNNITVAMTREALQLNEVVVTGAATTQERRNVATAVATVAPAVIAQVPAASLDNALQGKVVGAAINMNSGAPGGGGQLQIRGVTTILGNGDPLYVVDGVIISNVTLSPGTNAISHASGSGPTSNQDNAVNRLADINPEEIESVQVLKSAAATAIYGSQATNGVVIITTKRGRTGATTLHVTQRFSQSQPAKLLGSRHFTQQTLAATGVGSAFVNQYCPGSATTACPYFDYQSALYGQHPLGYETSANISGGTDQTKYYGAVHDKWEPGTLMNTGARRQDVRMNLDQTFGDKWTANLSTGVYRSISSRGLSNNDNSFTSPFYGLAYTPAVVNLQQKDATGHYIDSQALNLLFGTGANPFQVQDEVKSQEDVWRAIGGGTVKYAAYASQAQTLTLQANGGFDALNDDGESYAPPILQSQLQYGTLAGEAVQTNGYNRQVNGTLSAVHTWTPSSSLLRQLTSTTTSLGTQFEQRYLNQYSMLARGLVPGLQNFNQGTPTLFQQRTDVRNEAVFVNEEVLAFNEKLSLSGRVRSERSSVNGDRNKWYTWPAGAIAYHLPQLASWTDDIKLRASVGLSGNQPLYGSRDLVIQNSGVLGGLNALNAPTNVGNSKIRPESMRENEYGIDGAFFDSRVGFEASYFNRNITNLLLQEALAPSSGYGTQFINGGHMQTKGLELALDLLPIRNPSFTWTSHTTFYNYRSQIVELPVPAFVVASSGFGSQYGRGRIVQGYKSTLIWGNITHADGTVIDTAIADANPRFQMGFSNDFQLGSFSLNTLVDYRSGGALSDMTQNLMDEGLNSWDYDKPSPNPKYASLGAARYLGWNAGRNAASYIEDGTFVKLREITLTYRVPQGVSNKFFSGHDARLNVSGRNLHTWTHYWSFDPEVNNFGDQQVVRFVDLAPYPTTRSYFLGLDVSF